MYVSHIKVESFRHLRDLEIGPLAAPVVSDLVVLAGPNGGGKSSLLELLSYGFSNSWGFNWQIRRNVPSSSFEIAFGLSEQDVDSMESQVREDPALDPNGVLTTLAGTRRYFRAFNYPNGEYARDPSFHDQAHDLVSRCLAERVKALFLQSDRYYPRDAYNRNRYWDARSRRTSAYLRGMSFVLTEQQYTDQMEFLVEQAYDYPRAVGIHALATEAGTATGPRPDDPIAPYEDLFQRLYPEYRLIHSTEDLRDQLYVLLPGGIEVPFSDLSSGEKEVFFLLTFFVRHSVRESMVFIDEPELHLHPELARRLVRLMVSIQPGNQIWLGTHNPELIAEAGRDRTYFIGRPSPGAFSTAVRASDEGQAVALLRTLFGFQGFVGLARRIVFLEGDQSSADRQTFVQLFPALGEEIRFSPLNSADNLLRVNRAALQVLGETVGSTEFYLVRDRDYLTADEVGSYERAAEGRLFVLRRHEIENYLLDFDAVSDVLAQLIELRQTPAETREELLALARSMAGQVFKSIAAARLGRIFRPHDCSIGGFEDGRQWMDESLTWDSSVLTAASERFQQVVADALTSVAVRAAPAEVQSVLTTAADEVVASLQGDGWVTLFPGKELLQNLGRAHGIPATVLQNTIIRNLAANPARIEAELSSILASIVGRPT